MSGADWVFGEGNLGLYIIEAKEMFLGLVSPEEDAAEKTSFYGGLVDDDTIFLVVASEAGHGSDGIGAIRHVLKRDVLRSLGDGQCSLGVIVEVLGGLEA